MLPAGRQPERRMPYVRIYAEWGMFFLFKILNSQQRRHSTAHQHRKTIPVKFQT